MLLLMFVCVTLFIVAVCDEMLGNYNQTELNIICLVTSKILYQYVVQGKVWNKWIFAVSPQVWVLASIALKYSAFTRLISQRSEM